MKWVKQTVGKRKTETTNLLLPFSALGLRKIQKVRASVYHGTEIREMVSIKNVFVYELEDRKKRLSALAHLLGSDTKERGSLIDASDSRNGVARRVHLLQL